MAKQMTINGELFVSLEKGDVILSKAQVDALVKLLTGKAGSAARPAKKTAAKKGTRKAAAKQGGVKGKKLAALQFLAQNPETSYNKLEIARAAGATEKSVNVVIKDLADMGLIQEGAKDGRNKTYYITANGQGAI